jgi:hypothetical protein
MDTYTPTELALIELSRFLRTVNDSLYLRRLRVIERARYRVFLASFDDREPGKAPYGVSQ